MKSLLTILIMAIVIMAIGGQVLAKPKLDVGGQIRFRGIYDDRDFNTHNISDKYSELRTRVHLKTELERNAIAFVQIQDSRILGEDTSGVLNDNESVDIHQAYLQINRLWYDGLGFKAGRFEVNIGNQRVFGSVGWSRVGRAWDGAVMWYDQDDFRLSGYWLKHIELNDTLLNRDFDIIGLHAQFKEANLEFFGFYEYDADELDSLGEGTGHNKLNRFNLGFYHHNTRDQIDYEFTGVYQTGDMADPNDSNLTDKDISAYMFAGEMGYSFENDYDLRLAVGIDYTSGDDRPNNNDINAYNNLYYTGHKFRGYMDYFVGSPDFGLFDFVLRGQLTPIDQWLCKGDLHFFKAAADYEDFLGNDTKNVGTEFDLTVSTTSVDGVDISGGASVFFPSEAFAGMDDPDPKYWLYTMVSVGF